MTAELRTFERGSRLGSGHCGTIFDGFVKAYVSYGTVVGIEAMGYAFFTDRRHSVTTSKQRTTKLYRAAGYHRVRIIRNADFVKLCNLVGLLARITVYHNVQDFDIVSPVEF